MDGLSECRASQCQVRCDAVGGAGGNLRLQHERDRRGSVAPGHRGDASRRIRGGNQGTPGGRQVFFRPARLPPEHHGRWSSRGPHPRARRHEHHWGEHERHDPHANVRRLVSARTCVRDFDERLVDAAAISRDRGLDHRELPHRIWADLAFHDARVPPPDRCVRRRPLCDRRGSLRLVASTGEEVVSPGRTGLGNDPGRRSPATGRFAIADRTGPRPKRASCRIARQDRFIPGAIHRSCPDSGGGIIASRRTTHVGAGLIALGVVISVLALSGESALASFVGIDGPNPLQATNRDVEIVPSNATVLSVAFTLVLVNNSVFPGNFLAANGLGPVAIVYDPAKAEIFVANAQSNSVSVISDATKSLVAIIPVGEGPQGIAYDSGKGEIYVANGYSDTVSVISDASNTVIATIPVGSNPWGVAYDAAKGEVFVANKFSDSVSVISDATNTVVANVPVPGFPSNPEGVAYDPARGEVFVAAYDTGTVSVISDATNAVVATITAGQAPEALEYDSATGEIFVSHQYST